MTLGFSFCHGPVQMCLYENKKNGFLICLNIHQKRKNGQKEKGDILYSHILSHKNL